MTDEQLEVRAPAGGSAGPCSPETLHLSAGHPQSCCQDGHKQWLTLNGKRMAHRLVGARPCSEADGEGTNCGVGTSPFVQCVNGPCGGGRIEWIVDAAAVHIFAPVAMPQKCGWEAQGVVACALGCDWPSGGDRAFPEPFVDQREYPAATASCPFTKCAVGGIPL